MVGVVVVVVMTIPLPCPRRHIANKTVDPTDVRAREGFCRGS